MSAPGPDPWQAFLAQRATGLFRTAYLLTGDRAQAVDLLLTGLAAARPHVAVPAGTDDAVRVARRAMLADLTGWQRRVQVGHLLADSSLLAGTSALPGFGSPTARARPSTATSAALARLPARTRAVLVLRYGEGRSDVEVATELGRPVDEVAAETRRGLARFAELVGDATGDGGETGDVADRLRQDLAAQAAEVTAAPDGLAGGVVDRGRGDRRHLAGLLAVLAFLVAVVLLVAFSLG